MVRVVAALSVMGPVVEPEPTVMLPAVLVAEMDPEALVTEGRLTVSCAETLTPPVVLVRPPERLTAPPVLVRATAPDPPVTVPSARLPGAVTVMAPVVEAEVKETPPEVVLTERAPPAVLVKAVAETVPPAFKLMAPVPVESVPVAVRVPPLVRVRLPEPPVRAPVVRLPAAASVMAPEVEAEPTVTLPPVLVAEMLPEELFRAAVETLPPALTLTGPEVEEIVAVALREPFGAERIRAPEPDWVTGAETVRLPVAAVSERVPEPEPTDRPAPPTVVEPVDWRMRLPEAVLAVMTAAVKLMSPAPLLPAPAWVVRVRVPWAAESRAPSEGVPSVRLLAVTVRLPFTEVTVVARLRLPEDWSRRVPLPWSVITPPFEPRVPPPTVRTVCSPLPLFMLTPARPTVRLFCSRR